MDRSKEGAAANAGSPFNLPPSLEISYESSKDKSEILKINNRYIHSRFRPAREAEEQRFEGINVIAIFGLGLAYHVNNILKNNPGSYFIIYEPINEVMAKGVKAIESELLEANRGRILLLDRLDEGIIYNYLEKLDIHLYNRIKSYSNQGYKNILPNQEGLFFGKIRKCFEMIVQNLMTEVNFIPLWTKNIIYNIGKADKLPFLKVQNNERGENLALIICAGPTLDSDIEQIKEIREQVTIFAVDTALKPLLAHRIYPDFIVSLDGQFYSLDDFVRVERDDITFIFDILSYPGAVSLVKRGFYTATESISEGSVLSYYLKRLGVESLTVETGGTVADYTMQIAISMGFKRLYFAGLDLSFPLITSHCKSSPYHDRLLASASYFETARTQVGKIISLRNVVPGKSRDEGAVLTDFVLRNYGAYFENFSHVSKGYQLYYSLNGALKLEGFQTVKLNELARKLGSKRVGQDELIAENEAPAITGEAISGAHKLEAERLYQVSEGLKILLEETDFNSTDPALAKGLESYLNEIYKEHPYLKKFVLMTVLILGKKSITMEHPIWYKHIFFKLLQSIYYLIRTLQKAIKISGE